MAGPIGVSIQFDPVEFRKTMNKALGFDVDELVQVFEEARALRIQLQAWREYGRTLEALCRSEWNGSLEKAELAGEARKVLEDLGELEPRP